MQNDSKELFKFLYGGISWKNNIEPNFKADFKKCRSHNDVVKVYNKYMPYMVYGRTFNTMLKLYTDFRNIIRDLDTKNSKYALEFAFSLGDKDITKGVYGFKTVKRQATLAKRNDLSLEDDTNENFVKKMDKFNSMLIERIDNNNFSDIKSSNQTEDTLKIYFLTMLLGISTGRRMIEILKTLELSVKGGTIHYKGFAKKKEEDANKFESGYLLFINPNEAKKYLKMLRNLVDVSKLTPKEINKKYSNVLNSALNRYAGDMFGKNKPINQDGVRVDFHAIKEVNWKIWKKSNNTNKIITKEVAEVALNDGKKVCVEGWDEDNYIVMSKLKFHDLRGFYARYAYIKYGENKDVGLFTQEALHHEAKITADMAYRMWGKD